MAEENIRQYLSVMHYVQYLRFRMPFALDPRSWILASLSEYSVVYVYKVESGVLVLSRMEAAVDPGHIILCVWMCSNLITCFITREAEFQLYSS